MWINQFVMSKSDIVSFYKHIIFIIMENTIDFYRQNGFEGFKPVAKLMEDCSVVPRHKGVYMVLYFQGTDPVFLEKGTGGFFKGKDPNVNISTLKENWIEEEQVLYIGKATNLQSRIQQFMKFAKAKILAIGEAAISGSLRMPKNLLSAGRRYWATKNRERLRNG